MLQYRYDTEFYGGAWFETSDLYPVRHLHGHNASACACKVGKFTIGGVFAATMQIVCRLPGMTRYQLGNARIVLKSQYAGEAQPVPVGTFWATQVSRVRDIFTIRGMDAMGWMDVLVPPFTIDKENSGSHYYLNCIIDMIFFDDALFSYAGYIIQNVMYRMIDSANYWLTDKTGIPDLLSVTAYSETANYGVSYSNRYFTDSSAMWLEDPTTDQAFFRSDKDTNYKCSKPRDIARWCAELFGGFITVNRQGSFEMRQFCQPSLNIAQIQDADAEADSLEIAEYYMYPRKISACGMSRQNGYDTEWDYNLIDTKGKLLAFAKTQSKSIGDLDMQLDFLVKELQEDYPTVWKVLTTTTSVRGGFGEQFFQKFRGVTPVQAPVQAEPLTGTLTLDGKTYVVVLTEV